MIRRAEKRGDLVGVKVCRDEPMVSHLLFADDSLILMQAERKNADCLADILTRYCASSGQKVSEAKSSIFSQVIQKLVLSWRCAKLLTL